jgi:hypothetical protein
MLTLEQLRRTDPELRDLPESELVEIRAALYESAQLAFEVYWSRKDGSKYPTGSLTAVEEQARL